MSIDEKTVRHVALLARLDLAGVDVERVTRDMNAILEHVGELASLDVSGIPQTAHARPQPLPLREDEPLPGLSHEDALANAPKRQGGFVVVPRTVEGGGAT
ncbi:Asp-tRNA(Asn)/Glu-tRNA(Gln) amidotransferase subunit GatC [bacterium]|nr:Asp-tRNA(Asn)/Glu-tRNA(Gln) amidotransferase subunit GatC [bacterium]